MQVDIEEAQARFEELLDLVEQGEQVIISVDGVPMAELVKVEAAEFPSGGDGPGEKPLVGAGGPDGGGTI